MEIYNCLHLFAVQQHHRFRECSVLTVHCQWENVQSICMNSNFGVRLHNCVIASLFAADCTPLPVSARQDYDRLQFFLILWLLPLNRIETHFSQEILCAERSSVDENTPNIVHQCSSFKFSTRSFIHHNIHLCSCICNHICVHVKVTQDICNSKPSEAMMNALQPMHSNAMYEFF